MKLLLITAAIILLVFLLYFYCIMPRFTRKSQTRAFMHRLFAHRGLFDPQEGIPENSLPAFERAVLCGYPIELDVQITKDKKMPSASQLPAPSILRGKGLLSALLCFIIIS